MPAHKAVSQQLFERRQLVVTLQSIIAACETPAAGEHGPARTLGMIHAMAELALTAAGEPAHVTLPPTPRDRAYDRHVAEHKGRPTFGCQWCIEARGDEDPDRA